MNAQPEKPGSESPTRSPDDLASLPPVAAPNASFILQLFLIPMIIVSIIVVVWLMFSWIANTGNDPQKLVKGLHEGSSVGWQNASSLVNLLRNPHHDHLKEDRALAMSVAEKLKEQLQSPLKENSESRQEQLKLRVFTTRLLGEFRVDDVLPTLIEAATQENHVDEVAVRRSALEAMAVLADNVGPENLRGNVDLQRVLKESSLEFSNDPTYDKERAHIRSTTAFTLGVLGGDFARDQLAILIDDPDANTRYNAAVALARLGDIRSIPVLNEMLDPDNAASVADEDLPDGREFKRIMVMTNAARAARMLITSQTERSDPAFDDLKQALQKASDSSADRSARTAAREALQQFDS